MSINAIDENVICSILEYLPISSIITFTSTCKAYKEIQEMCLANNDIVKAYVEYDDKAQYMDVLRNSHIESEYPTLQNRDLEYDREKIRNTCKIICYSGILTNYPMDSLIRGYCKDMLHKAFGYTEKKSCERSLDRIFDYHDTVSIAQFNIDIFDMYQLVYHIQARKYKNILTSLQNIKIVKKTYYFNTMNILIDFINYQQSMNTKAVMVCLIYIYIDQSIIDFIHDIDRNKVLLNTVLYKTDEFCNDIHKKNNFPKYLKNYMIDTIKSCSKNIYDELDKLQFVNF